MSARSSVRSVPVLVAVAAMLGAGLAGAPAQAAVGAPGGLTPSGGAEGGNPVLSWDRVPGATSYDVQVATTPDFSSLKYKVTTTNRRAVPTVELPTGDIWWRVQANSGSGDSDWSTTSYQNDELAGPILQAPVDGAVLDQPEDPALLSWEPVEGALSYSIEIDDEPFFIEPSTYSTKIASFVVPKPQIATTYYWQVRAVLGGGVVTRYSDIRTYKLTGLEKPVLTSPADNVTVGVEDIVLDWEPVLGAATYDLQVSTDANFNTIDDTRTGIKGTRYSPPITLGNDQYFWRVRPVDTHGNVLAWEPEIVNDQEVGGVDVWSFRRHWPDQPHLEYPVEDAVVGDPFYYQWSPVHPADEDADDDDTADKADRYVLQMSPTGDFQDPAVTESCVTVHTTYTPGDSNRSGDDCYPDGMGTYSWRVIAYDGPRTRPEIPTDAISAEVQTFSYKPETVLPGSMSPAHGSSVEVPTLSWDEVAGAAYYRVSITALDGGAGGVTNAVTHATSYTSPRLLTPGKRYRWSVQTVSGDGRLGPVLTPDSQPTFTVAPMPAATASTPSLLSPSTGAVSHRVPTFTWTAVEGASYYKLGFRKKGAIAAFTELPTKFAYPAGEDTEDRAFDDYEWVVSAYGSDNVKIGSTSASRWFTLAPFAPVTGGRAAITGRATESGATACEDVLPARCEDLRQTPVLRWDPVRGAGLYKLYLSRDKEMTNLLPGYPRYVDNTAWMSYQALFDSQAGEAFYWSVSPCVTKVVCNPPIHAPWAFNKKSNPVELVSPADGATVANDVTFTWGDYLETNLDDSTTDEVDEVDETGVHARIEARQYRVEVSTVPNFQTLVDKVDVDQTTYTAFGKAYPEGTLYWRVSAIDGSGNVLTSSRELDGEYRTFKKESPKPTRTRPLDGSTMTQADAFTWEAMPFASSYDIEVYRSGDPQGQPGNRVFSGSSKQPAYTPSAPLPASGAEYAWRIRRVDASGNPGDWTGFTTFEVTAQAPTLTSPAATKPATILAGNDALFTWQPVDGATSYRFERRAVGSTSVAEVVTTVATAWAPLPTIGDGTWEWRVSTVDAAGKVMASSEWRAFRVDATSPVVTKTGPSGRVAAGTTFAAVFSEPVRGVGTTTFRIYQKGVPDPVPAAARTNAAGTKATLDPKRNLKRGKTYTVKIHSGITDGAGNALPPVTWKVRVR